MKMRIKVELRFVINTRCMMSPEEEDDDDGACLCRGEEEQAGV